MTHVVNGYNHDSRELVDIPELRALLRGLESEWPDWTVLLQPSGHGRGFQCGVLGRMALTLADAHGHASRHVAEPGHMAPSAKGRVWAVALDRKSVV